MLTRPISAAIGMLWLAGCCARPPTTTSPTPLTTPATSTITGRVFVAGPISAPKLIQRTGGAPQLPPIPDPTLRVTPDGGVADVVVEITDAPRDPASTKPSTPVVVIQRDQLYDPSAVVVRVGQTLVFRPAPGEPLHNPHPINRASSEFGQPLRMTDDYTFDAPERFKIKCDVHPWMSMAVAVVDHPYATVTDPAGRFTLPPLPPGRYTLSAWHPRLGTARQAVDLPLTSDVRLELKR